MSMFHCLTYIIALNIGIVHPKHTSNNLMRYEYQNSYLISHSQYSK